MRKKITGRFLCMVLLLLSVVVKASAISADTSGYYRKQLQKLLLEREQKFNSYSQSLQERNGIFGGKTKKDILRSNEILKDLVKNDNQIIDVLNRVVDFRNYEKASMVYDKLEHEQHVDHLLQATDTLSKQVNALKQQNNKLKANNRWLVVLAIALFILALVMCLKRKNS